MSTHAAIVAKGLGRPLEVRAVPTAAPGQGQVRVRVEWVPSSPLDVRQVEAGLMAQFPQGLGDSIAGTVVEVGSQVKDLNVGDKVSALCSMERKRKQHRFTSLCQNISSES